jgi:hypothetical protein
VTMSDDCVKRARRVLRVTSHSPRLQRYKTVAQHTFQLRRTSVSEHLQSSITINVNT